MIFLEYLLYLVKRNRFLLSLTKMNEVRCYIMSWPHLHLPRCAYPPWNAHLDVQNVLRVALIIKNSV